MLTCLSQSSAIWGNILQTNWATPLAGTALVFSKGFHNSGHTGQGPSSPLETCRAVLEPEGQTSLQREAVLFRRQGTDAP